MKSALTLAILLVSALAFGHGEDKPGPHGGHIRMPGAFHTEVVPVGTNKINVFLLDIDWKNPSVLDSSVTITFDNGKKTDANCEAQKSSYLCIFPNSVNLHKKGKLVVAATREKQSGNVAEYSTPLQFSK